MIKTISPFKHSETSTDQKKDMLRQMLRIRRFEERSVRAYQQGKIGGFCHTYIGQEAIAVGVVSVMGDNDHIITAYRDHGHALAVGMNMNECMAELFGKYTGCSKGKGGSMHFFAPDKRFWGGHGIVAGQTPLGLGIAYALKYQGKVGACLCFLGDGASNQGVFFESLNMAELWDIPVIYVIENNRYSMGTSMARHASTETLAQRGAGLEIEHDTVDGNDLETVRLATAKALKHAHDTKRPYILEMQTYRYRGHSMSDPDQTYRSKDEIKEQQATNDPIERYKDRLIEEKVITAKEYEEMSKAAKDEAEASAKFADESPFPPPSEIMTDVYADTSLAQKY